MKMDNHGDTEFTELLRLEDSGIRVAQYLTELPPKELLQKKLHDSILLARERLAANDSRSLTVDPEKVEE